MLQKKERNNALALEEYNIKVAKFNNLTNRSVKPTPYRSTNATTNTMQEG